MAVNSIANSKEYPQLSATEFYYKSNLTQEDCAQLIGVPKKTFEKWHRKKARPTQIALYWMYHVAEKNNFI